MTIQVWIAAYAAVVATGALGWQVLTFCRNNKQSVNIEILLMRIVDPIPNEIAFWSILSKQQERSEQIDIIFALTLTNLSTGRLQITEVMIYNDIDARCWDATRTSGAPMWLESREEKSIVLDNFDLHGLEMAGEFTVVVHIAGKKKGIVARATAMKNGCALVRPEWASFLTKTGALQSGRSIDIGPDPTQDDENSPSNPEHGPSGVNAISTAHLTQPGESRVASTPDLSGLAVVQAADAAYSYSYDVVSIIQDHLTLQVVASRHPSLLLKALREISESSKLPQWTTLAEAMEQLQHLPISNALPADVQVQLVGSLELFCELLERVANDTLSRSSAAPTN